MDYIVLDLEWNQSPTGKDRENPRIPFEIIEIGAVRMNESFEILDSFSERIRPQVYHQLHYRTKQLLKVNIKEFYKGRKFALVMQDFLKWCGDDYVFATWGPMDLDYLQNNMDYYHMKDKLANPLFYYDIQKLFSLFYEDGKSRKSLQYAVEFLSLEENRPFHCAVDDASYTARVLKTMDPKQAVIYVSVDYHNPPSCRENEIYLQFPEYSKFVSMIYPSKDELLTDRMITVTRCHICGHPLRKKIRWFTSNNSTYYCLSYCNEHGFMQGKLRLKKAGRNACFAIRTTKMIDNEKADMIREKQDQLHVKRKIRRSRSGNSNSYKPAAGAINISVSPTAADKRKKIHN